MSGHSHSSRHWRVVERHSPCKKGPSCICRAAIYRLEVVLFCARILHAHGGLSRTIRVRTAATWMIPWFRAAHVSLLHPATLDHFIVCCQTILQLRMPNIE